MANATEAEEACPAPFLPASRYPSSGGFIAGRFCVPVPRGQSGPVTCCLPCPREDWVYRDSFFAMTRIANYINVVGLVCCFALLLSFAVLPLERTHRHYLSVCLILGIVVMHLGFIIPLGAKPSQCYNDITPNDMFTSITCALSGAALQIGGWCAVMWVFMRALALHLQICWQVVTGRKFFVAAQLAGWGIPVILVASSLALTGVSFRFGDTCHINHRNGLQVFWAPLLTCAAAAIVVQFATFGYCIKVYLQSLIEDRRGQTNGSTTLPSYSGSVRTATAAHAYRRVRRVVALQWRGIAVVLLILTNVVFFSCIFIFLDQSTTLSGEMLERARPWLFCLVSNDGDKNKCLDLAHKIVLGEPTVMAVLILLSMNGIWCLGLLGRWSMVLGWRDWFRKRFKRQHEFVSIDARSFSNRPPLSYEMLQSPEQPGIKSPEGAMTPNVGGPGPTTTTMTSTTTTKTKPGMTPMMSSMSPMMSPTPPPGVKDDGRGSGSISSSTGRPDSRDERTSKDSEMACEGFFGRAATYNSPQLSFSSPRPPQTLLSSSSSSPPPPQSLLSSSPPPPPPPPPPTSTGLAPSIGLAHSPPSSLREWDPTATFARPSQNHHHLP